MSTTGTEPAQVHRDEYGVLETDCCEASVTASVEAGCLIPVCEDCERQVGENLRAVLL